MTINTYLLLGCRLATSQRLLINLQYKCSMVQTREQTRGRLGCRLEIEQRRITATRTILVMSESSMVIGGCSFWGICCARGPGRSGVGTRFLTHLGIAQKLVSVRFFSLAAGMFPCRLRNGAPAKPLEHLKEFLGFLHTTYKQTTAGTCCSLQHSNFPMELLVYLLVVFCAFLPADFQKRLQGLDCRCTIKSKAHMMEQCCVPPAPPQLQCWEVLINPM